jgi:hypothetical protein
MMSNDGQCFAGWEKPLPGDVIILLLRPWILPAGSTFICSELFYREYIGKRRGAILGIAR